MNQKLGLHPKTSILRVLSLQQCERATVFNVKVWLHLNCDYILIASYSSLKLYKTQRKFRLEFLQV